MLTNVELLGGKYLTIKIVSESIDHVLSTQRQSRIINLAFCLIKSSRTINLKMIAMMRNLKKRDLASVSDLKLH